MNEMNEFREYVEEQKHLCYGVEGTTSGLHGSISRQYDFLLETIDEYQELNQTQMQLGSNQETVLDYLKEKCSTDSFISYSPFEAILRLNNLDLKGEDNNIRKAIDELSYGSQAQVLEVFSKWVLEQEDFLNEWLERKNITSN